jgi:Tol biopolymer transport system component
LFYTIDVDGTNRPDGSAGSRVSPAWSPDGAYLAFLTDQKGEWQIWIMEADGRNPQPLVGPELDGLTLVYDFNDERALSWTR